MKKKPIASRAVLTTALNYIYQVLYYLVKFFIFVGEITTNIFLILIHIPARTAVLFYKYVLILYKKAQTILFALFVIMGKSISNLNNGLSKTVQSVKSFFEKKYVFVKPVRYAKKESRKKKSEWKLPTLPKLPALPSLPTLPSIHFPKIPKITFWNPFNAIGMKVRYFILGSLITVFIVSVIQSYYFVKSLPSPANIGKINYPLSTHIYDKKGNVLYEVYRDQNRTPIVLKELPKYVAQATVAIEDKDFYRHNGISVVSGVLRAFREFLLTRSLQGGSTLTQQLVKSALLTPERTIQRKIKEAIIAIWAERMYTKDEILQMYLNQVAYGGSAYGIEEASKVYFHKHANELTLAEAATLAGLPQAPSLYSPYVNPKVTLARRNEVLNHMYEEKYITLSQLIKAKNTSLEVVPLETNITAPHFVFYVKSLLEQQYGVKQVEEGGLRVTTTIDLEIQKEAEKILKEELAKVQYLNVTNGAILVTKPSTGEIVAMVGSVDYFAQPSGAFNVTTGLRQPGSSIKPLMYSLALEKGFTPATIISDTPVTFNIAGTEAYRPVNYDGKFHGAVPLRYALANSYNIPAVRLLSAVGVDSFVEYGKKMGISSWGDPSQYGLSLTLGGGEVTMIDMAKAFGVFANVGYRTDITPFETIQDADGQTIYTPDPMKTKVINEGAAYLISDILSDNFARRQAFGAGSALEIPGYKVAVKTGTTDWKKDNWTIGYTPEYLVTVWVGNNDGTPMNQFLASGITGAAPIWNRVMSFVLKRDPNGTRWFEKPPNVVERNCFYGRTEVFIAGTENSVSCTPPPSPTNPRKQ